MHLKKKKKTSNRTQVFIVPSPGNNRFYNRRRIYVKLLYCSLLCFRVNATCWKGVLVGGDRRILLSTFCQQSVNYGLNRKTDNRKRKKWWAFIIGKMYLFCGFYPREKNVKSNNFRKNNKWFLNNIIT